MLVSINRNIMWVTWIVLPILFSTVFLGKAYAEEVYPEKLRALEQDDLRWETPWVYRADIVATVNGKTLTVYQDPFFKNEYFLYGSPYRWVISFDTEGIESLNSGVIRIENGKAYLNKSETLEYGGSVLLAGVGGNWDDVIMECKGVTSLYYILFGKSFTKNRAEFDSCDGKYTVIINK